MEGESARNMIKNKLWNSGIRKTVRAGAEQGRKAHRFRGVHEHGKFVAQDLAIAPLPVEAVVRGDAA